MTKGRKEGKRRRGVNVLFQNIPFMFFLMVLSLFYIANAHYAEKKVRQIERLKKEVKTLKWEYWTLQSQIMKGSTQSELERKVEDRGLLLPDDSPKRIWVNLE